MDGKSNESLGVACHHRTTESYLSILIARNFDVALFKWQPPRKAIATLQWYFLNKKLICANLITKFGIVSHLFLIKIRNRKKNHEWKSKTNSSHVYMATSRVPGQRHLEDEAPAVKMSRDRGSHSHRERIHSIYGISIIILNYFYFI